MDVSIVEIGRRESLLNSRTLKVDMREEEEEHGGEGGQGCSIESRVAR